MMHATWDNESIKENDSCHVLHIYWCMNNVLGTSILCRSLPFSTRSTIRTISGNNEIFWVFSRELFEYLHLVSMPTNWLSWWDSLSTKTPQWFSLTACTFCKLCISEAVQEVENSSAKYSMGQTFCPIKRQF